MVFLEPVSWLVASLVASLVANLAANLVQYASLLHPTSVEVSGERKAGGNPFSLSHGIHLAESLR